MADTRQRRLPAWALRPVARLVGRFVLDPRLPLATQRQRREKMAAAEQPPEGVTTTEVTVGGIPALRHDPPDARDERAVLFLHGGGYVLGTAASYRAFAGRLAAATRAPVVVPDYRLAPEHPHPAALDDASAAYKELASQTPPERVAVVGDSAGAGLAVALAATLRDAHDPVPAALGLISPWLDLAADRTAWARLARRDPMLHPRWLAACARAYAGGRQLTDPALSPLRGELAGLPPTYLVAGGDDVLVIDADRFALAARDAGVEVDYTRVSGLWHDFLLHVGTLAAADHAMAHLVRFLDARWDTG